MLLAKSPLSFCCGAIFSLLVFYLWRSSSFGFAIDPYLEGKPLLTAQDVNESFSSDVNDTTKSSSNETIAEKTPERYSVQDVVSNSTLGVSLDSCR